MSNVVPLSHPENPPNLLRPEVEGGLKKLLAMLNEPWREGTIEEGALSPELRAVLANHKAHLDAKEQPATREQIDLQITKLLHRYPSTHRWSSDQLEGYIEVLLEELDGYPLWAIRQGMESPEIRKLTGQNEFPPGAGTVVEAVDRQMPPFHALREQIRTVLAAPERSTKPKELPEETAEHRAAVIDRLWTNGLRLQTARKEDEAARRARQNAENTATSKAFVEAWRSRAGLDPEGTKTPWLESYLEGMRRGE